jgi:hypothetical protein
MLIQINLRAGRHINLESTYRTLCARTHKVREIRMPGSTSGV